MFKKFAIIISIIFCYSCASTNTMVNAPLDEGVSKVFPANFKKVLQAVRDSLGQSGLILEESRQIDDNTWIIVAQQGASLWSWGERIRIYVGKTNDQETIVRVLTKRKLATNITAKGDYSNTIFSNIDLNLKGY